MNASVAEDWEDLVDVCEPYAINLQPFERAPTPPAPLNHEDTLLCNDEELIDPEKSKKLHGMVTYTLRSLGTDFTNSSIETAFGVNGLLLRSVTPKKSEVRPQNDIVEFQNQNIEDSSCLNSGILNREAQPSVSNKLDDNNPSNGNLKTVGESMIKPPDESGHLTYTKMASIAKRVKRNVALSSIMAGLMDQQNTEVTKESPVIDAVDNVIPDSCVENKLNSTQKLATVHVEFDSTEVPKEISNLESRIDKVILERNNDTALVSPVSLNYRKTKNHFNIFDSDMYMEPSTSYVQCVVPPEEKSKKITLSSASAKKAPVKQSADEIYKLLIEKRNAARAGLSAHYSTDCNNYRGPEIQPRTTTLFDLVQKQLEKKRKK